MTSNESSVVIKKLNITPKGENSVWEDKLAIPELCLKYDERGKPYWDVQPATQSTPGTLVRVAG